jgi:hypothetical protein
VTGSEAKRSQKRIRGNIVVVVALPEAVPHEIDVHGKASVLDSRQVELRLKARKLAGAAVGSVNLEEINRGGGQVIDVRIVIPGRKSRDGQR